ncbi:MAG: HAD-IB family phosphatase [Acidobacteria bacterium]|nr:HAD-IB family phosphatase [Acidobacteriota bacterium]
MNPNYYLTETFLDGGMPVMFLDFDGTIAEEDVIDRILGEFADPRWLDVEDRWLRGAIGSRECLRRQFALVRAAPARLDAFLATLRLDEGLPFLLRVCADAGIPVHIVSDGFEYYIRRLLRAAAIPPELLEDVRVWANRLEPAGGDRWRTRFPYFAEPCRDGCATCKPGVMKFVNRHGAPGIFVGDGLSDRFAARAADVVFAKKKLSAYCLENRIPQTAFAGLRQVAESLDAALDGYFMTLDGRPRNRLEAA